MSQTLFESSDSARHAKPLRYAQSFDLLEPLDLELGGCLPNITVAYETYGELSSARDNAILVCHAISGDSHVARHDPEDDAGLVGHRGRARKTHRYRPLLCDVPKPAGRLPRHHRPQEHQSRHGQTLRTRFSHCHGRRHGRGAAPPGGASGHQTVCWRLWAGRWEGTRR